MKKSVSLLMSLLGIAFALACGTGAGTDGESETPTASDYADFGASLNESIPEGLRTGGASASVSALLLKELSGTCAVDYTECPYLTASGGADSAAGEILSRLWGIDYDDECTAALLDAGTCFTCTDCQTGTVGNDFIKPTYMDNPTACATTSTTEARYVNFGIDPCYFDSLVANIPNVSECNAISGSAVSIASAVPWYASWGLPQTVNFSGYQATATGGGLWWTVNSGTSSDNQYFIMLDSNWLYGGVKNPTNNDFLFFGTGSPAYYDGLGEGLGINIAAYTGNLVVTTPVFEAIQIRDQTPNNYIERLKSDGAYLWYQYWYGGDFPSVAGDLATVKDTPTENRCVLIGSSVATSQYVPLANCVTSFGKESVSDLNLESNYTLKLVDAQTAESISFSTPLTSTTTDSCLEEEESTPGEEPGSSPE